MNNSQTSIGEITINRTNVVEDGGTTIESASGFNPEDVLTFTFTDKYYSYNRGWGYHNSATYTATCTVGELLSGTTLNFTHP